MKFLLVNENVAVKKLFNISAKKADIKLDIVESISSIPIQEDYNYIFIDDGVNDLDSAKNLRNKMITTKFCLILSKNNEINDRFSYFDKYIRKPFLPTDIYDVLKKEKYNDISLSTGYDDVSSDINVSVDNNINLDSGLLQATDVSDIDMGNINDSINNISLSDFNDSQDEFISGSNDDLYTIPEGNNDYNLGNDIGIMSSDFPQRKQTNEYNLSDDISIISSDVPNVIEQEQSNEIYLNNDSISISNLDIDNNVSLEQNTNVNNEESDNMFSANTSLNKTDDIDFSSVFALQDEILQNEQRDKKALIGGDISIQKSSNNKDSSIESLQSPQNSNNMQSNIDENMPQDYNINISNFPDNNINDLNLSNDFSNINVTQDSINNDFVFEKNNNVYNDNDFSDKNIINDTYNIETMSEQELELLDDETLLKLQDNFSSTSNDTMILDKNTIDEVNNILEKSESYDNDVKIVNQDLNSLTEEALNEALQDNNQYSNINNTLNTANHNFDYSNNIQSNVPNINVNNTSDLAEIIKAFPIDKLRELLSGAQITINITFPSKN